MSIVLASHSMALDGFIAQPDGKAGPLHEWLWTDDHPSRHGVTFKLSEESRERLDSAIDRVGATIAGRRTYDDSGGWGGALPFDWPFFIVTHDPPSDAAELPFIFVTEGVERADELAKEAAQAKNVTVMGGDMTRQCLAAGLLDEIDVDLVPVVLGAGVRLFDESTPAVELDLQRVVEAPGVRHPQLPRRQLIGLLKRSPQQLEGGAMDWKLEVVSIPVSDVDRAKAFYTEKAGFNADHDHRVSDEIRFVQLTPPGSACSIALGTGLTESPPGSAQVQLVVPDIHAAHAELVERGVDVGDVQEFPWGSFVFFSDPDGNRWAVQQLPAGDQLTRLEP